MKIRTTLLGTATAIGLALGASSANAAVVVELGLALDASGSIDNSEFAIQRQGYIDAFNDPTVVPRDGSVAVAVYQFASSTQQVLPTTVVDNTTIGGIITTLTNFSRLSGGTNIGAAITALQNELLGNSITGTRTVIDVSTDGAGFLGNQPGAALAAGIDAINCLGIGVGANCNFTGGTGSFAITGVSFADFSDAIKLKIRREVTGTVSEPAILGLLGFGLAGIALARRRRV